MIPFATRNEIKASITRCPWTRNFRHLLPVSKKSLASRVSQFRNIVRTENRIKYWNVVPGDQVRILGDKSNQLREISDISRFRNRVWIRAPEGGNDRATKNFHYSRCQLFLGNYEFPASTGSEPQVLPVFAQRLGTSKPVWNYRSRRWDWQRFATKTMPVVPHLRGQRIKIPWPKYEPPQPSSPGLYDTTQEAVAAVTYKPPPFSPSLKGIVPRPPTEKQYLFALYNPHRTTSFGDAQPPAELYLYKELSNPHSRAKKLARWKAYQGHKKALLTSYKEAELKQLNGRSTGEATAEATWKWREALATEQNEKQKQRWKHTDAEAKMEKKRQRKSRKMVKQRQRLTQLVLRAEPNQIIPQNTS